MTFETLLSIEPFSWGSVGAAALCGTIVGLERQLRGKPVGIRTSSLIVLGTYIFIAASISVAAEVTDPSRIIGQVVTGIGFLGAGVMLAREGMVVGVTSAATIWALAAVGVCLAVVGALVAIKLAVLVVLILFGVDLLEDYSTALSRGVHSKYSSWRKND
ncbi:MgtC/SapB family protein [Pseudohalioglobus lutimaris]|uniref:Protein MgtC n=1 Tax=Pseudohalioglobus lutimaris TaxID=1737061 RepID=A0A2N5X4Y7_9GAMM|nr:MgtC/SapB family protein [Pseudohalioglobus lutimaris]PLW69558.1 MgtC/SapB family protein [Pseudohalioglobus lutimaris]